MFNWIRGGPAAGTADSPAITPQAAQPSTVLFRFVVSPRGTGEWKEVASGVTTKLYDANEDTNSRSPEWRLEVEGAEEPLDVLVDDNFDWAVKELRASFVTSDKEAWALKFANSPAFERFLQKFNKAAFENRFGQEHNDDTVAKNLGAYAGILGGPENEESKVQWVADMDIDQPHPEEFNTPKKERVVTEKKSPIHGVVMGAGEHSYLMRGGQIDVIKNSAGRMKDTGLSFVLTPPPKAAGWGGAGTPTLTPSKALLMDSERTMAMISPLNTSSMWQTDIETGKVISEWKFQKDTVDVAMKDMAGKDKAAAQHDGSVFLALGASRLAVWDMKTKGGVVSEQMATPVLSYAGGKDYAAGVKFSCMATSGDGYVVVGADDGKVRLYSEKTLTQAKTSIPGMGLPITAVDVTFDGKWVLATTKNYMMVLKTTYEDPSSGKELCGFTSRMGSNSPAPRLLRLKMEDVKLTKGAPLQKGKFTWVTEKGRQERYIIATCGNYTVTWNFRSIKVAEPDVVSYGGLTTVTTYHLQRKDEHVVDSAFMHENYARGRDAAMVVTTNKVFMTGEESDEDE
ncbi:hypothetical protein D9Q98_005701 [Chlorella vulgaris]|uniref:Vacuolar import/degradation Vid27 C-terminal domain-containing protein n=1 Tax=Chlorella vulgaris TaxID=3077 RepID=A0A9D4TN75_CHLVU|nr:hypothetical protein D9Q98_005701 [Chlorella vulgaris]